MYFDDEHVQKFFEDYIRSVEDSINADKLKVDIQFEMDKDPDTIASDAFKSVREAVERFRDTKDGQIKLSDILDTKSEYEAKLLSDPSYVPTDSYEKAYLQLSEAADQYGMSVESLLSTLSSYQYIQSDTNELAYDGFQKFTELSSALKTVTSQAGSLNSALQEQASAGAISLDTYSSLVEASEDFADCLQYENGSMVINAEAAQELVAAKAEARMAEVELQIAQDQARWEQNTAAIQDMKDAHKELTVDQKNSIAQWESENSQIEENIRKYRILYSELKNATGAYAEWKNAKQTANGNTMYDDIGKAIEDIEDGIKTRKIGTDDYKSALKLAIPVEFSSSEADIQAYLKTIKRYFADGVSGMEAFLQDAAKQGLVEFKDGMWSSFDDITSKDFVERMKLTPEMVQAIFANLEDYGFQFNWDKDLADPVLDAAKNGLDEVSTKLDELYKKREELAAHGDTTSVEQDIWATNHERFQLEVAASGQTDVEKLIANYRLKFEELQHELTLDPDFDTTQYDTELDKMREQLSGLGDDVKQAFDIDPDLFEYGIASMSQSLLDLGSALDELKAVSERGFSAGTPEYDTAYQRVKDLISIVRKVPDIKARCDIDFDELERQILSGDFDPDAIVVDITADDTQLRKKLGSLEGEKHTIYTDIALNPIGTGVKALTDGDFKEQISSALGKEAKDSNVKVVVSLDTSLAESSLSQIRDAAQKAADVIDVLNGKQVGSFGGTGTTSAIAQVKADVETVSAGVDTLSAKQIGTLGAKTTLLVLHSVYAQLKKIDDKKIKDKTFTVRMKEQAVPSVFSMLKSGQSGGAGAYGTDGATGGKTLVGELGRELVVSGSRYYTVGENGAEFVNLKRGDIVFNNADTEKIFSGYSGARGAPIDGPAYSQGTNELLYGGFGHSGSSTTTGSSKSSKPSKSSKSN